MPLIEQPTCLVKHQDHECAPFHTQAKGGSFTGDTKDFFRFILGEKKVIPAFEEAVASMKPGGIRRIIVPSDLGYPDNDYGKAGPKPTTFSVRFPANAY